MEEQMIDGVIIITIGERLSYESFHELKTCYEKYPKNSSYVLDFSRTQYIDSAGLGVLLTLREHNTEGNEKIKCVNCNDFVNKILTAVQFHKLFDI